MILLGFEVRYPTPQSGPSSAVFVSVLVAVSVSVLAVAAVVVVPIDEGRPDLSPEAHPAPYLGVLANLGGQVPPAKVEVVVDGFAREWGRCSAVALAVAVAVVGAVRGR